MDREIELDQEDIKLVKAFQNRNDTAFDRLVLKYQDAVFNLCYRFLGEHEEALDCAQEVFVKVFRSLKNFRMEAAFSTWLYRIAVNTCKNKVTSLEYRRRKNLVWLDQPAAVDERKTAVEIADCTSLPEKVLEQEDREAQIQRAINALPAEQKMVVVLRDIEGWSYEQIAERLGYRLGTVKSKLARAREELKNKLKGSI
jgi:RNA polymerase sigma-70 factor (ECF subfamily)